MNTLTIFYDAHCGLCRRFRRWMQSRRARVRLEFLPFDSPEARDRFPGIEKLDAGRELVVMADDGAVWQGPGAWVTCLWALEEGRPWARRLASPLLLPFAGAACRLISENRLGLSALLMLRSDAAVAEELARRERGCPDGTCGVNRLRS